MGVTLIGTKFKSILKNGSVCDANQVAINGTNLETYLNSMSPICEFNISNISNNTSNFYNKTIGKSKNGCPCVLYNGQNIIATGFAQAATEYVADIVITGEDVKKYKLESSGDITLL